MPDDKGTVWLAPPPPPLALKAMNLVMRPVLTSRLGRRISGVMLLQFRGRRSGRRMKVPVNFNLVDGVPAAFTTAVWRKNFTAGAPVTVTHRGQVHQTTGSLVPITPEAMGLAVRKSLDTGGSTQRMGIRPHQATHRPLGSSPGCAQPLGTSLIRFDFTPSLPP